MPVISCSAPITGSPMRSKPHEQIQFRAPTPWAAETIVQAIAEQWSRGESSATRERERTALGSTAHAHQRQAKHCYTCRGPAVGDPEVDVRPAGQRLPAYGDVSAEDTETGGERRGRRSGEEAEHRLQGRGECD
ncbi:hypothetical protein NDU88_000415 [Pleurodeles waltl]|uniref:Uncharacterized protein n=1 Tax=Pleurodeles waltl TaxID=8319 RepID=A0AAV7MGS7_PLEWA|nr:hypothetical protein NDU88_000415 [Pleurodeles waltl]